MKLTLNLIKKGISIMSTGAILLTFLISILSTNTKSPNFIEYTDLSKFFLNLYMFIILALIFCHTIYPKIICSIFTKRFAIITTEKGKLILLSAILIMYFGTGSTPQKVFGIIAFLATFGLFISKYCNSFKKNTLTEEKISNNFNSQVVTTTSQSFNN